MKITRINHAAVNVRGVLDEARAFYTELLGLPEVPIQLPGQPPIEGGKFGFWIEQQGVQLHVIARDPMGGTPDPTQAHVSWYVEDLPQAIRELQASGRDIRTMGEGLGQIVWVLDPAGNIVELQQDPKLSPAA